MAMAGQNRELVKTCPTLMWTAHSMLLAASTDTSGPDKPVRGAVQGSPNDDDVGDGQDQERDRRGEQGRAQKNEK